MGKTKHKVIFQPMGTRLEAADGETLRAVARDAGVAISSVCAERATCGKCRVIVQRGDFRKEGIVSLDEHLSPADAAERSYWEKRSAGLKAQGEDPSAYRLSCQARVHGDVVVMVPQGSRAVQQVVRKAARERTIELKPNLRQIYLSLEPATLANPRADWERVKAGLAAADELTRAPGDLPLEIDALTIDLPALRDLQSAVRDGEWGVTVSLRGGREVVRVEPGYADRLVGMAIDIGTTTIAGHLCDLRSGEILATVDMMNPQVGYGEDIISRMAYVSQQANGLETLRSAVIGAVNQLSRRAARQAGMRAKDILELVVVGNSVMHHLFLGIDTLDLGRAPYVPATHASQDIRARDLGLDSLNAGAYVHWLPLIASYVGADCMGVLLAEAPHEQDELWLVIDVGTNAELVLGNRERLVCTSTPTGPAFEGAHVEFGMRAAEGAIERVEIDPQTGAPRFKVIGSQNWSDEASDEKDLARGICGSGIIDAVAALYRAGIVDSKGRFVRTDDSSANPHLQISGKNQAQYVLARKEQTTVGRDILITQADVRHIQLAKSPLYVASHYLLSMFGVERPDRILLAGGFGSYIDPLKAMLLGMIPDCDLSVVHSVGNSAGDGARIALLNREKRQEAMDLLARIERIELPAQPGFQDQFMLALNIPHMIDTFPHLEGIAPPREVDPLVRRMYGAQPPPFKPAEV